MHGIPKTIFISAGEASGDLLGAELATQLLQKNPSLQLIGMGGKKMQDAGVHIQFNYEKLSVIGAAEIIKHLPSIMQTWRMIKNFFKKNKPDLVILIDFPDTHFRFFKTLKKLNIPILYYVSPQIWAWRASRIDTLKKYIHHMCVLFSFEEKLYQRENMPVTFVGHPLSQLAKATLSKNQAYDFFKLDPTRKIIALFPGSRRGELAKHLPLIIATAEQLKQKHRDLQYVLVLAPHFSLQEYRDKIPVDITIIQNHLYDLLQISTAAIAVSGTVTLEIALMQVPLCIIYRVSALSFWIAKKVMRIKQIGLCNILMDASIAKEFIQEAATPKNIADEIEQLLTNADYYSTMKRNLASIKAKVSLPSQLASEKVADIAMQLLEGSHEAHISDRYRY